MQGTLFDLEPIVAPKPTWVSEKAVVAWSFSRRNVLETCPRKYYYQYYAAKHEKRGSPKTLESLRFLKTLSNQYLVLGKIVHNLIRLHFTHDKPLNTLKWMVSDNLKQSIDFSSNYEPGDEKGYKYPPQLLQEVFWGDENCQTIYQEVEEKACLALENFCEAEDFKNLLDGGKQSDALIEKMFKIEFREGLKITGELDLAFETDDEFILADWKTGKVDDGDDSMQLLTYTWWAMEEQGIPLEKIKMCKAYLLNKEVKEFRLSERDIFTNKMAIRQSAEIMLEMAEFGEAGDAQAFTPCRQSNVCSNCQFQNICH